MLIYAWGWCMGMTQRDVMGREVGGGFMFGNVSQLLEYRVPLSEMIIHSTLCS